MKNSIYIALALCLFATAAFATQTSKDSLAKIEKSQFGREVLQVVQLELTSGAKDPRPKIVGLLTDMLNNIADEQNEDDKDIAEKRATCEKDTNDVDERIANHNSVIQQASGDIADAHKRQEEVNKQINDNNDQISATETLHREQQELRDAEQKAFEEFQAKYSGLIDALAEVRIWVQERQDEVKGTGAFLQFPSIINFAEVESKVAAVSKISPAWGSIVSLIKMKIKQVPESTEKATKAFDSILETIDRLLAHFRDQVQTSFDNEQQRKSQHEQGVSERVEKIGTLKSTNADLTAEDAKLTASIIQNTNVLETAQSALESAKQEKESIETRCQNQEEEYENNTKRRNDESDIIKQILAIMNNDLSSLTRYMTDRLEAHNDDDEVVVETNTNVDANADANVDVNGSD